MKLLTNSELMDDLEGYYDRLQIAKNKLANLPVGYLPIDENEKREKARRVLNDEIRHVENLIKIATEALKV
jgi:adenine specific DNA methylase Mod